MVMIQNFGGFKIEMDCSVVYSPSTASNYECAKEYLREINRHLPFHWPLHAALSVYSISSSVLVLVMSSLDLTNQLVGLPLPAFRQA
ncbi:MAG: hypothetical protein JKX74_01055 [Flavobacteriales bacterium]|nr:hypothetical protein [Flavobacteriales bacterium]